MLNVRMRVFLLIFFTFAAATHAASIKKVISESETKTEVLSKSKTNSKSTKKPIPAIVAIEIVNDKLDAKNNSKRTIESALGYGYSNPALGHELRQKLMIYKYSQHDIPPLNYNHNSHRSRPHHKQQQHNHHHPLSHHQGALDNQINVQNSVGYYLGSTTTHTHQQPTAVINHAQYQTPTQYYTPANTLYSTFDHQGQLGGLSHQIPYETLGHSGMVPVILLRVYTNQLANSHEGLHTNLPQTSGYSDLNSINLQSVLQGYVQNYMQNHPSAYQQLYQDYQGLQNTYLPTDQQSSDQSTSQHRSNLPTTENYPSKLHTRVIFHSNNNGHIPEIPKTSLNEAGLLSQSNYVQASPEMQYIYTSGNQQEEQQYQYVYPSQMYYQQEQVSYEEPQAHGVEQAAPVATQNAQSGPYDYHPPQQKPRNKKNSSRYLQIKKREPELKST